jgi:uncharacterized protein
MRVKKLQGGKPLLSASRRGEATALIDQQDMPYRVATDFGELHMTDTDPKKAKRGFASMDPEKRREIARMGGKAVPPEKRSFSQNAGLAAQAGSKGGRADDPGKRSFSRDRELAASAGTKGGHATHGKRKRDQKP